MLSKKTKNPILKAIHTLEDSFLVILLSSIIVIAISQIVMRNVFDSGFSWADALLRLLVLWVGLAGAMVATRQDKQLTIDILTRSLPDRLNTLLRIITDLLSSIVCAIIAYHGWRFVQMDKVEEVLLFADIPAWWGELIIPFAFGVIALRYLAFAAMHCKQLYRGAEA